MDPEADRQRVEVFLPSRQESQKITYEALKKGIRLQTVLEVADQTARWADEAIDVVKDEYNPPLDCKEGCWYCCCNPEVLVSVPELLSILESIRSKSSDEELAGIASRAKARAAHRKGRTLEELAGEQPQPCPLLVNERCSVYPVRPMVCRGFNSMRVEECKSDYESATGLTSLFALVKDAADGVLLGVIQTCASMGVSGALVDLHLPWTLP